MRRTIQAAAAGLVLATAGCASASGGESGSERSVSRSGGPVAPHVDTPLGGTWRLVGLAKGGRTIDLTRVDDPGARFAELASFSDGCHGHSHHYRVTGSTVRFDSGAVTADYCRPGPWSPVSDALNTLGEDGPVPWQINDDRLTLTSGRYVLTYGRTGHG